VAFLTPVDAMAQKTCVRHTSPANPQKCWRRRQRGSGFPAKLPGFRPKNVSFGCRPALSVSKVLNQPKRDAFSVSRLRASVRASGARSLPKCGRRTRTGNKDARTVDVRQSVSL
jgi:hypothetical protein